MKNKEIQFVEMLLKAYKSMKAERTNLNIKWNMLERQKRSAIEGQFLSASVIDKMPGIPRDSYKEYPVLMIDRNQDDYQDIESEQTFITTRIKDLEDILTIIDNSLLSLPNTDKDIVFFYYVDGYSLQKISCIVYLHSDRVWSHKQKALEYLYESLRVLEGTGIFKSAS